MADGAILVLDVGKTNSKLSLWDADGRHVETRTRANAPARAGELDIEGVEAWMEDAIRDLAQKADIAAIVPVAHGAAAAFVAGDQLLAPPLCYEDEEAHENASAYAGLRDPFSRTGSPRLPAGLNLGAQLYRLEQTAPELWRDGAQILTFAQYWAWRLSGVAASEATTLGCHSDLWFPFERRFSDLAQSRGWARRFAPLRPARDVLGPVTDDWRRRTGLSSECVVYCGMHDSNAAFHGARAHHVLAGRDATVISTGTWFVAMRAPAKGARVDASALTETRDTLINVDVDGNLTPSSRFMGGREVERLIGGEDSPLREISFVRDVVPSAIDEVLACGAIVLPSFARGVGPFPQSTGRWLGPALEGAARRAAVSLYLALVTDASLSLIGARDAILIEGRFADDTSFVRMLAALRPDCDIYTTRADDGLAFGALRLVNPSLIPKTALTKVEPLQHDIAAYVARWRSEVRTAEAAV